MLDFLTDFFCTNPNDGVISYFVSLLVSLNLANEEVATEQVNTFLSRYVNPIYCENEGSALGIALLLIALSLIQGYLVYRVINWFGYWLLRRSARALEQNSTVQPEQSSATASEENETIRPERNIILAIAAPIGLYAVAQGIRLSLNILPLAEGYPLWPDLTIHFDNLELSWTFFGVTLDEGINNGFYWLSLLIFAWLVVQVYERLHLYYAETLDLGKIILSRAIFLVALLGMAFLLFRLLALRAINCAPDCIGINVPGGNLSNMVLTEANFVSANLRETDLSGADLRKADLSGADLTRANLRGADLSEAKLLGANLRGADLRNAVLTGTDLSGANLNGANLTRTDLTATKLNGVDFTNAKLVEVDLSNLSEADILNVKLSPKDPRRIDLSGIKLLWADLTGADLRGIQLSGVELSGANLSGAFMGQAELSGALLNMTTLTGVDLSRADLSGVSLIGAQIDSANLAESALTGAILVGANMAGADLRDADLTGARLFRNELQETDLLIDLVLSTLNALQLSTVVQNANLSGVRFSNETQWPQGRQVLLADVLGPSFQEAAESPTEAEPPTLVDEATELPALDNEIWIAGSVALSKLTEEIHTLFEKEHYTSTLHLSPVSASDGFRRFCVDSIVDSTTRVDIVLASRPIEETEVRNCHIQGRGVTEFRVGSDTLAIVINPANDFLADATTEELALLFTVDRWFDVNQDWPTDEIIRFVPEEGSGPFSLFVREVLSDDPTQLLDAKNTILDSNPTRQIRDLATEPNGIAFLDYAFYQENTDLLQLLTIDGISPSALSVESGEYLFSQPLFLYSDPATIQDNPRVRDFLEFYLDTVNDIIEEEGYFRISDHTLNQAKMNLQQAAQAVRFPYVVPLTVQGDIILTSSPDTLPFAQAAASHFIQAGYRDDLYSLQIGQLSTAAGFRKFCQRGETDGLLSNRLISAEEAEICVARGRSPVALLIGFDLLTVVANPNNEFLTELTLQELAQTFTAQRWSDVNPSWPNDEIVRLVPPQSSRMLNLFTGRVFTQSISDATEALLNAPNIQHYVDPESLVRGIAAQPNTIGLLNYLDYQRHRISLKLLSIEGVEPSATVTNLEAYPLARPLFLYLDANHIQQRPQIRDFAVYVMTNLDEMLGQVGYLPLDADSLRWTQNRLLTTLQETENK